MATETKIIPSFKYPTPLWFRKIVRVLTWVTGVWAFLLLLGFDLKDFGVPETVDSLILKYMAILTASASAIGRGIGEKPIKIDTDYPLQ